QFGGAGSAVDVLELNSKVLTLNGTIGAVPNANSGLKGDLTGSLFIQGTGALGTVSFLSGSQTLKFLVMNLASSGPAIFPNNMTVDTGVGLTEGVVNMGGNTLTANGSVNRDFGWLIGNLQRNVLCAAGPNCTMTFDVGTANGYSPVTSSLKSDHSEHIRKPS